MAKKPEKITESFTVIHKECCGFADHRITVESESGTITFSYKNDGMYKNLNKGDTVEINVTKK